MENAKQSNIGSLLDAAMQTIEQENQSLKGVLPKVYAKENLDLSYANNKRPYNRCAIFA